MPEALERALAGDRSAFDELVDPHRAELLLHCYRLLGSYADAEDALQETLLAAWLALAGFEGRSSLRTWLYRIATTRSLNLRRSTRRAAHRQARAVGAAAPLPGAPPPTATGEVVWLQPFPDAALDRVAEPVPGPEARYEQKEAVSLAFVRMLQLLPPRQRAVVVLRDVLGYPAADAADLLGVSVDAANGALKRARATLADEALPEPDVAEGSRTLDRLVDSFLAGRVDDVVELLTDDAWLRMPPLPAEYRGREAAREFLHATAGHRHGLVALVPVGCNRQPAWGEYVLDAVEGHRHLIGVLVADLRGSRVAALTHFDTAVGALLGLPRTL
ncbi:MAG: RNA polymerase subunit sigma-70 [Kineosporiaceae bacterium]